MDLFDQQGTAVLDAEPVRCPSCDAFLSRDRTCWHCCDRLCRACDRPTGSAFIGVCWSCWFRDLENARDN